eukprot:UN32094
MRMPGEWIICGKVGMDGKDLFTMTNNFSHIYWRRIVKNVDEMGRLKAKLRHFMFPKFDNIVHFEVKTVIGNPFGYPHVFRIYFWSDVDPHDTSLFISFVCCANSPAKNDGWYKMSTLPEEKCFLSYIDVCLSKSGEFCVSFAVGKGKYRLNKGLPFKTSRFVGDAMLFVPKGELPEFLSKSKHNYSTPDLQQYD